MLGTPQLCLRWSISWLAACGIVGACHGGAICFNSWSLCVYLCPFTMVCSLSVGAKLVVVAAFVAGLSELLLATFPMTSVTCAGVGRCLLGSALSSPCTSSSEFGCRGVCTLWCVGLEVRLASLSFWFTRVLAQHAKYRA